MEKIKSWVKASIDSVLVLVNTPEDLLELCISHRTEAQRIIDELIQELDQKYRIKIDKDARLGKSHIYQGVWCSHTWYEVECVTFEKALEKKEVSEIEELVAEKRRILAPHLNFMFNMSLFVSGNKSLYSELCSHLEEELNVSFLTPLNVFSQAFSQGYLR